MNLPSHFHKINAPSLKNYQIGLNRYACQQIWDLAGPRIWEFCKGFPTYLIQEVKNKDDDTNPNNNDIIKSRFRRSTRHYFVGRIRGQTQSQYLNFGGPGNSTGKAEAESAYGGSRAIVVGTNGMGQAQSQSSPFDCDDCYKPVKTSQYEPVTSGTGSQNQGFPEPGTLSEPPKIPGGGFPRPVSPSIYPDYPGYPTSPDQNRYPIRPGETYPNVGDGGTLVDKNRHPEILTGGQGVKYPDRERPGGTYIGGYGDNVNRPGITTAPGQNGRTGSQYPGTSVTRPTGPGGGIQPGGTVSGVPEIPKRPDKPIAGFPSGISGTTGEGGIYPSQPGYSGGGYPTQPGSYYPDGTFPRIPTAPGSVEPGYPSTGNTEYPGAFPRPGTPYPGYYAKENYPTTPKHSEFPGRGQFGGNFGGDYGTNAGHTGRFSGQFSGVFDINGHRIPQGVPSYPGQSGPGYGGEHPGGYIKPISPTGPPISPTGIPKPGEFQRPSFGAHYPGVSYDGTNYQKPNEPSLGTRHPEYGIGTGGGAIITEKYPGFPDSTITSGTGGHYPSGIGGGHGQYIPGIPTGQQTYIPGTGTGGSQYKPDQGVPQTGPNRRPGANGDQWPYIPGTDIGQGQYLPGAGQGHYQRGDGTKQVQYPSGPSTVQGQYQPGASTGQEQYPPRGSSGQGRYQPGAGVGQGQYQPGTPTTQGQYRPDTGVGRGQYQPGSATTQGQYQPDTGFGRGQYQPGPPTTQGQYQPGAGVGRGQYLPGSPTTPDQYQPDTGAGRGQYQPEPSSTQGQYQPGSGQGHFQHGQERYPSGVGTGQYQPGAGAGQGEYQPGSTSGQGQYQPVSGTGQGQYQPPIGTEQGARINQTQYGMTTGQLPAGTSLPGTTQPSELTGDDGDSQAQTSLQQINNETQASAQAQGKFEGGSAQSQVSGTYSGSGSFSASAGSDDGKRGALTQVSGGKKGATSSAQGHGGRGRSQAQMQLDSDTGKIQSTAQSGGMSYSSQTQVQGGDQGGMANAQSNGAGHTSSQAQIGFSPYKKSNQDDTQKSYFVGGGTSNAQGGSLYGQSQSQIQGKFRYGIKYSGGAQAQSGNARNTNFTTFKPLNTQFHIKPLTPIFQSVAQNEEMNIAETRRYDEIATSESTTKDGNSLVVTTQSTVDTPNEEKDNEEYDYEENINEESSTNQVITQSKDGQMQRIVLPNMRNLDARVIQTNFEDFNEKVFQPGDMFQPGQLIPGTSGYRIPFGFRGKVKSMASPSETYAFGHNSQAQSVTITPGSGKIIYRKPQLNKGYINYAPRNYNFRSMETVAPNFLSISKSETGYDNPITGRKVSSTHYTQSSTCGLITNTCIFQRSQRICLPNITRKADGSVNIC